MSNKDLLKQAIAEAKTIREAAIANAKEALEESLTPHLKEMLAQKLQEMENDEMEEEVVNEEGVLNDPEGPTAHGNVYEAEEEEDEPAEEEEEVEGDEEEVEEDEEEIDPNDPDFADKLKDLIRDIVAQETGHEDQAEMDQLEEPAEGEGMVGMEDEEEIDINELLAELEEGNQEEVVSEKKDDYMEGMKKPKMEAMKKPNPMEEELDEALATVAELRTQLQEVNLLNAKLLYVNKVFKANNLTEGQKVNVVAAFDKAETVREVKLVFETVSKNVTSRPATTVKEHKSFASKPAGSTQKQVINEVSEQVKRMQKLAGII